jgi:phosphatidylethanolamine-binding protein (PEBP) family uncharacterized protein
MDRSFLSHTVVITAAKKFVCIRLTSYEDETEKKFVSKLVNGEVANTAFAILAPDGTRAVSGRGPGRGPRDLYKDAEDMAKGMDTLAEKYTPKKVDGVPALPIALSAKVGLAVAAGDLQPLIVVVAKEAKEQANLEKKVAELAWSKEFAGHFTYAFAESVKDIPKLKGKTTAEGVLLIEPDIFGSGGKVVKEISTENVTQQLSGAMRETLKAHVQTTKNRRELAELGLKEGIFYETGIPVSGKGEATDRERYKKQLDSKKPKADRPKSGFTLSSPSFEHNGKMPVEFTGDGDGVSPPLSWTGAPEGTKYYALQLWHKPKADGDEVKSYWVVTNIPAKVTSLEKNSKNVGKDGFNDKKHTGYDPMNSKGPGAKEYHITLYALSAEPKFDTEKVTRAELLKSIKDITLAETTLSYTYERKVK